MAEPWNGVKYRCSGHDCVLELTPRITTTNHSGNQGRAYIICNGPRDKPHKTYFRFTDTLTPPSATPPTFQGPTMEPDPPQPTPSDTPPWLPRGTHTCVAPGCGRPGHRTCSRRSCKNCCIAAGGSVPCTVRDHRVENLSTRQREKQKARFSGTLHPPFASTPNSNYKPTLPPLDDSTNNLLEGFTADNPTLAFFAQADTQREVELTQQAREAAIEHREEQDFQIALAASLGQPLPVAAAPEPLLSSSSTTNQRQPAMHPTSSMIPSTSVQTVPYRPPTITQHMNTEWMRPVLDNTKKPRNAYQNNPDHRFFLVFWGKDNHQPDVIAIDDCPKWPHWKLSDSNSIMEALGVTSGPLLEFYHGGIWVKCAPTFSHKVAKTDSYLLLRRQGLACHDFDDYWELAKAKMPHLRDNMVGERMAIKKEIWRRKKTLPLTLVQFTDDDGDELYERSLKRRAQEEHDDAPPVQRFRTRSPPTSQASRASSPPSPASPFNMPSSPSSPSPSLPSPSSPSIVMRSPSITTSSPHPIPSEDIYIPESSKPWPHGMYTIDMAHAFRKVDSIDPKAHSLSARLLLVFGEKVPKNTYNDQKRYWGNATEAQRERALAFGHKTDGLWAKFPKNKLPYQ